MPNTVYSGSKLVEISNEVARRAHGDQMYGDQPYIYHLHQVADLAASLEYPVEVVAAAYLHDTIEDTSLIDRDLLDEGIPLIVVEGVLAVSSTKDEPRVQKIRKARAHPIGHVVKFCDSSRNFEASVDSSVSMTHDVRRKRALKYAGYLGLLAPDLPNPEDIEKYIASTQIQQTF